MEFLFVKMDEFTSRATFTALYISKESSLCVAWFINTVINWYKVWELSIFLKRYIFKYPIYIQITDIKYANYSYSQTCIFLNTLFNLTLENK